MTLTIKPEGGRGSARIVRVWDPLVRLIHWSLALTILLNGAILEEESKLHEIAGYVAFALVGVRIIWGFVGTRHASFAAFPPSIVRARRHLSALFAGKPIVHLSHNPLGALMAYNLWLTVLMICVTGYMMTTLQFFGAAWVEDVHEAAFNWLVLSVVLHLGGIAFETWWSGVNLVRAMFDGAKRIPGDSRVE